MRNYQLNIRSCHDPECDYGRQSLTLAMQNFSIWTGFPQISIEMGWEMGNILGMYRCYSPALVDPYWEKLPYWDLKVSGKFYFSLQPMYVEVGRVRVDEARKTKHTTWFLACTLYYHNSALFQNKESFLCLGRQFITWVSNKDKRIDKLDIKSHSLVDS